MTAEVSAARSEVLMRTDPAAAIVAADAALLFYRTMNASAVVRKSELLLTRAGAREARGDIGGAALDYEAAITALELDQDRISRPQARKAAFDQQRAAMREAIRFTALIRHDSASALWIAERVRARLLRQRLGGVTTPIRNPALAHRYLPNDVAVLYYVTLPDRVLGHHQHQRSTLFTSLRSSCSNWCGAESTDGKRCHDG
jgi:hypothetical protein